MIISFNHKSILKFRLMSQNFCLSPSPKNFADILYWLKNTILVLVKVAVNCVLFGVNNKFQKRQRLFLISSGKVQSREREGGGGVRFCCSDLFYFSNVFRDTKKENPKSKAKHCLPYFTLPKGGKSLVVI